MRTAIVTGAARGIGFAIAEKLVSAGNRVVVVDVLDTVHESAKQLNNPSRVLAMQADIRNQDEVRRLMASVVDQYGTVDILVNNAGTNNRSSFEEMTLEHWQGDVDTNMTGTFLMCQAAIFPYMKRQGYGHIINIASVSGKVGGVGPVHADGSGGRSGIAYAAAKAALGQPGVDLAPEVRLQVGARPAGGLVEGEVRRPRERRRHAAEAGAAGAVGP